MNAQIKVKNEELEEAKEYAIVLKELMVKDEPKTKNRVVYIATTKLYAKNNLFKVGGKIFDDLQVKKDRKDKFPILRAILAQLRPEIKLILKQN